MHEKAPNLPAASGSDISRAERDLGASSDIGMQRHDPASKAVGLQFHYEECIW